MYDSKLGLPFIAAVGVAGQGPEVVQYYFGYNLITNDLVFLRYLVYVSMDSLQLFITSSTISITT